MRGSLSVVAGNFISVDPAYQSQGSFGQVSFTHEESFFYSKQAKSPKVGQVHSMSVMVIIR
jgi:hypothetical protein